MQSGLQRLAELADPWYAWAVVDWYSPVLVGHNASNVLQKPSNTGWFSPAKALQSERLQNNLTYLLIFAKVNIWYKSERKLEPV